MINRNMITEIERYVDIRSVSTENVIIIFPNKKVYKKAKIGMRIYAIHGNGVESSKVSMPMAKITYTNDSIMEVVKNPITK